MHDTTFALADWFMLVIRLRTAVWMAVGNYYAPGDESITLDKMMEYIRGLPMEEQPEVFGMHDNALVRPMSCNV